MDIPREIEGARVRRAAKLNDATAPAEGVIGSSPIEGFAVRACVAAEFGGRRNPSVAAVEQARFVVRRASP
jgi:hypothetical protein